MHIIMQIEKMYINYVNLLFNQVSEDFMIRLYMKLYFTTYS